MLLAFRRKSLVGAASATVAVVLSVATPASAQLVNDWFDLGPPGPVGNFGLVVGPPATYGIWGAEDADIVPGSAQCFLPALSPNFMLALNPFGGSHSQAWQAVNIPGVPPPMVTFRARANSCIGGQVVGLDLRFFNSPVGWPAHTLLVNNSWTLDPLPNTWQTLELNCVPVPPDTRYILAQFFLVNSTAQGLGAYFDNAELFYEGCPVSVEPSTWSRVKSLVAAE
jgi:hypothetical protein